MAILAAQRVYARKEIEDIHRRGIEGIQLRTGGKIALGKEGAAQRARILGARGQQRHIAQVQADGIILPALERQLDHVAFNALAGSHLTGKISTEGDGQHTRFIGVAALCDGGDVYARDHNVLLPAQIAQVQANLFAIQHGAQHIAQRDILGIARRVWLGNRGGGSPNGNPLLCIHRSYERLLSANV